MTWVRHAFCVKCSERLGRHQEMYSHGICPFCGFNSDSTICDTNVRSARLVRGPQASWWQRPLKGDVRLGHWEYADEVDQPQKQKTGDDGGMYWSGVYRKGSDSLMTCHHFMYAPPLFWNDNEAQLYIKRYLTKSEAEVSEIRRVYGSIKLNVMPCIEFVKLDGCKYPANACSRCGHMRSAHDA